ncbi:hypothetical protein K492DRAFT_171759 [Lichtheimia hyalospora FSU 10163]|nr:hypothetical protein K492DRAFT_171759 [Lichtheimia hyalospora FSU 10163]
MREIQSHQPSLQELFLVGFVEPLQSWLRIWSSFKQLRRLDVKRISFQPEIPWLRVEEMIDQHLNIPNLRIRWDQDQYKGCHTYILNSKGRYSDR